MYPKFTYTRWVQNICTCTGEYTNTYHQAPPPALFDHGEGFLAHHASRTRNTSISANINATTITTIVTITTCIGIAALITIVLKKRVETCEFVYVTLCMREVCTCMHVFKPAHQSFFPHIGGKNNYSNIIETSFSIYYAHYHEQIHDETQIAQTTPPHTH